MKEFSCTKCGSKDIFKTIKGTQTGLYCSDCGKWLKWLSKDEIRLVDQYLLRKNREKRCDENKSYPVITLCGSTRFKDDFLRVQKELTLQGNIVISVGLFGHSGDSEVWAQGTKEMLDNMHKVKIDMADSIYVINTGGYIGESTGKEIQYALLKGKDVTYMER